MSKWIPCSFSECNYRTPGEKAKSQDGDLFCSNQCAELARSAGEVGGDAK